MCCACVTLDTYWIHYYNTHTTPPATTLVSPALSMLLRSAAIDADARCGYIDSNGLRIEFYVFLYPHCVASSRIRKHDHYHIREIRLH